MTEGLHDKGTHGASDKTTGETGGLSRRHFLTACGCVALPVSAAGAAILASSTRAEAQVSDEVIRIGHLPAGCVSHLLLAKTTGMFADAGLNVELTQFNGPSENLQALVAGGLHAMHNPWTTTLAAYGNGTTNLRIVGGSGLSGVELVAREGSVRNVQEFIAAAGTGLRVGTLRLDTLEVVGYGIMAQNGKTYDDYEMTFFPSMVGMGEALAAGDIDVCTLVQPYAESVVRQANGIYLANSNDVWGPEAPDCVITSTTEVMEDRGEVMTAYMTVLANAARAFYDDFASALDILQPIYGAPREILEMALLRQSPDPVINAAGAAGIRNGVRYLIELGYFDTNIADEVMMLDRQPFDVA
ncbi:MAG: ABC transporter substrate-binding protein [Roseicyclus sp.]